MDSAGRKSEKNFYRVSAQYICNTGYFESMNCSRKTSVALISKTEVFVSIWLLLGFDQCASWRTSLGSSFKGSLSCLFVTLYAYVPVFLAELCLSISSLFLKPPQELSHVNPQLRERERLVCTHIVLSSSSCFSVLSLPKWWLVGTACMHSMFINHLRAHSFHTPTANTNLPGLKTCSYNKYSIIVFHIIPSFYLTAIHKIRYKICV